MNKIKEYDISGELSRTYTICVIDGGVLNTIEVNHPVKLFWAEGHAFHRVFDGRVVHLCPAPGILWGSCGKIVGYVEMTWKPKDKDDPCKF